MRNLHCTRGKFNCFDILEEIMEEIDTQLAVISGLTDANTQTANAKSSAAIQATLESTTTPTKLRGERNGQLQQTEAVPNTNSESAISVAVASEKLSPQRHVDIENALAEVRNAWQRYRSTNRRNAVYFYLEAVFALVTRWGRDKCALKNSRVAFRLQLRTTKMKAEPFGIIIFCTCDPAVADAKMRSKWSRVLRFARKAKRADQGLTDFIKTSGGINKCAGRFSTQRGRRD
jgi:hypothetical protein